jgi:sortase A
MSVSSRFMPMPTRRARQAECPPWLGAEALVALPELPGRRRARIAQWLMRLGRVLNARRFSVILGLLLAAWGLGSAGYIHAKAAVAQVLLQQAWQRTLESRVAQKPWPWADTWPVARLRVPGLAVDEIVLNGASGRTLAFAPGLAPAAAQPGEPGNVVISGHRDTHFRFLRAVEPGQRVWLETGRGAFAYEVERMDVVDTRKMEISADAPEARLSLVTCYPFDALTAGGPLRYVVTARLVASGAAVN